jgi:TonB family protein
MKVRMNIRFVAALIWLAIFCLNRANAQSGSGENQGRKEPISSEKSSLDSVATTADVLPVFKKGDLEKYLQKNLEYPEDARNWKIQGKVFVTFVVDSTGKLLGTKLLKRIGYGCDEEALDLINETSGKWIPGTTGGKKVRVRMTVPVVFSLGVPIGK